VLFPHEPRGDRCFQLLGCDVLLDAELKPWLIEVNRNPSLRCEAPLDAALKTTLLCDVFRLVTATPRAKVPAAVCL
jgi:hypothetical protein